VKSCSVQVERRAVAETANDVRVPNSIERDGFILKILDEGAFEIRILVTLKQNVKGFDNDVTKLLVRRSAIPRNVNLGITAVAETLFDVIAGVKSAL
jgi:hypothetical protein